MGSPKMRLSSRGLRAKKQNLLLRQPLADGIHRSASGEALPQYVRNVVFSFCGKIVLW